MYKICPVMLFFALFTVQKVLLCLQFSQEQLDNTLFLNEVVIQIFFLICPVLNSLTNNKEEVRLNILINC